MADDIVVGSLLVCSSCINLLALCAFWMTPSLRTLSNRFVINLLVINFVSCFILTPPLLIHAFKEDRSDLNSSATVAGKAGEVDYLLSTVIISNKTIRCRNITNNCTVEKDHEVIKDDFYRLRQKETPRNELNELRSWGLDLVVALSVLSVLLVVVDTYSAITNPLRYHAIISNVKSWLLIFGNWFFGALFGVVSACRNGQSIYIDFDSQLYNTMFSYTFFFVIILLPFALVVCMYWRIFSEARGNGQRMRQNGSSPLIQSTLNLYNQQGFQFSSTESSRRSSEKFENQLVYPSSIYNSSKESIKRNSSGEELTSILKVEDEKVARKDSNESFEQNHNSNFLIVPSSNYHIQNNFDNDGLVMTTIKSSKENLRKSNTSINQPSKNSNFLLVPSTNLNIPDAKTLIANDIFYNKTAIKDTRKASTNSDESQNFSSATRKMSYANLNELRQVHSTPNLQEIDRKERKMSGNSDKVDLSRVTEPNVSRKSSHYVSSLKHRLSSASSLFRYREESRAARISVLVVIMFLLTYLPYGILVLMQGHPSYIDASDQALLAILTVMFANVGSPFIFAYRNRRVRRSVRQLFGIDKETNERLRKLKTKTFKQRFKNKRNSHGSTTSNSNYFFKKNHKNILGNSNKNSATETLNNNNNNTNDNLNPKSINPDNSINHISAMNQSSATNDSKNVTASPALSDKM